MSSKEHARSNDLASKRQSPQPAAQGLENLTQRDQPATIIRRAKHDPGSLTPTEVAYLQNTIGNQAISQLLASPEVNAQRSPLRAAGEVSLTPSIHTAVVQRKKLSDETLTEAENKFLRTYVSGPGYYKTKLDKSIRDMLDRMKPTGGYDDEDVKEIADYVLFYVKTLPFEFDKLVDELGKAGGKNEYVVYLKSIVWPNGKKPAVVFGPAVTTAFYDAAKHVVTLDPMKLNTETEALDALTFECQNALQRRDLQEALKKPEGTERGEAVAGVEYESDRRYVEALKQINNAKTIDELVANLAIPMKFLQAADYGASKTAKKVARPDRSELPDQDKRQALWWWKTKTWSDDQRKEVWMLENHGEGVKSSTELYAK